MPKKESDIIPTEEIMSAICQTIKELNNISYEKGWDDAMLAVTNGEDL